MLYIDLETYSAVDLPKVGVYRYAEDSSFRVLMAAFAYDDDDVQVLIGHKAIRAQLGAALVDPTVTKVAHNAQFERVALSKLLGYAVGTYLPPVQWEDTQALAAEHSWPQGLLGLARALGAPPKDTAGTRLINLFCKPGSGGQRTKAAAQPDKWKEFVEYCRQDVITLRQVYLRLPSWPTTTERRLWLVDQAINDRGMRVDVPLAVVASQAAAANMRRFSTELQELTGLANPNSTIQMLSWLKNSGLDIQNMQAGTIQRLLDSDSLQPKQRRALQLRQELAGAAIKKFEVATRAVNTDGRLRGGFKFFGAHTGRWAGKGLQPHNLPRDAFDTPEETEDAANLLMLLGASDQSTLKRLVRGLFIGPLTVVDYSAIEARVIAWLAGETWAIEAFQQGRDIYVETAERMGGMTRFQGKVAVLALGYSGGVKSLRAMGYGGITEIYRDPRTGGNVQAGVLGAALESTLSPAMSRVLTDEEVAVVVRRWRKANPAIVQYWSTLATAFRYGGTVGSYVTVEKDGKDRHLVLPSGRALTYRACAWHKELDDYGRQRVQASFADTRTKGRIRTYGGRLAENVTQAVARDVLAAALIRLDAAGLGASGHVHDEVIIDTTDLPAVKRLMLEQPSWAPGLPLAGEGFTCSRYLKG